MPRSSMKKPCPFLIVTHLPTNLAVSYTVQYGRKIHGYRYKFAIMLNTLRGNVNATIVFIVCNTEKIIYPNSTTAPWPDKIKEDFLEEKRVFSHSPTLTPRCSD